MFEEITVAICNYNTPDLLKACIASIKKNIISFRPKILVLDNSDKIKTNYDDEVYRDVQVLDNTQGKYINFNKVVKEFGKCFDENYGSLKHSYSIQWLLNICNTEKMLLLDVDVIIKHDFDQISSEYISVFDISQRKTYKPRALPYIQLFNVKMIKELRINYFDSSRIRGGTVLNNSANYDTGASFLEDVIAKKLSFKKIDFTDYIYHLRSASIMDINCQNFLSRYQQYWKNESDIDDELQYKVIVSLTSWKPRIEDGSLFNTLKSLVNQKFNGKFKIALTLTKDENDLIDEQLKKFIIQNNIKIIIADRDLKPHKKYFYSMKKWKQLPIVTFDDDAVYDENVLQALYNSYKEFPHDISAMRTHRIQRDSLGHILSYKQWNHEFRDLKNCPSPDLFATGVGGVLYPEDCLRISDEDILMIEKCIGADDVFLKKKEQDFGINTVFVPFDNSRRYPYTMQSSATSSYALCFKNNSRNSCDNDMYIKQINLK